MNDFFLTALILFSSTLISSTFGFGNALFAMPLLVLVLGLPTATPLFGLVGPTASLIILARNWQRVEFASAWRLIMATFLGIPMGALLIKQLPGDFITQGLGIFLIGFGIYRLANWHLLKLEASFWAIPFGFVAGILGGEHTPLHSTHHRRRLAYAVFLLKKKKKK
ncbi:MAG: TSUP family transporter, partial [Leptolyngbya sp. SIO1D8]|nr:TSUP family transporter [Leptolyngbya sp. SIO1D8]